ncbi:hypothetical protein HPB49_002692 [Dermacentor silvarum]|uniref:Uncharacterized protein n=1 Tax=Dermacentor silvarum TaxID=543639 RepID=A0ACB8CPA4_DERSI|nr:hypothetical protein HPB49_002692 [Dermacentor silvarum]
MANALRNTDADKAHQSSTEASEDEDMEIRESQGLLPAAEENEEHNEPWINVTSRARRRRLQTRSTTPQLSQTPTKPVLCQRRPAMSKPRQPPLPADDYKLAVRPRNGLQLNKRTVPHCRTCNETGHREDVCPRPPATPKCRECGTSLATEQHEREPPDGSQNLPQQIPATRQPSETAAGPESRLFVSETTWRAFSFPQAQDLIATTDAIPWQDLEPWTFLKWQEGKQGSSAGHAAELAQAHAHIRRLTEENATLKAEISKVHAEFVALKDELLGRNSTTPTQSTSTPPPEKRKREEQPAHTVTSNPTPQRATAQPTTPQGVIPVQYATPEKVEEIVAKAIQSLQTSLQATMQQQLTAIQQSAAQQQFATQQQHSNTEMAERIMRLEERILALEARQSRRPKKAAHQALPDLPDSLGSPEPHLVRASPPLNNQDGSSSTYMQ